MKIAKLDLSRKGRAGFTLVEMLVTVTLFAWVIAAVLTGHLFGMRMFEISRAKLSASDDARKAAGLLISDIRCAKTIQIGNADDNSFDEIPIDTPQIGNAVQLTSSTDTNLTVRYYLDTSARLKRWTSDSARFTLVASSVTNSGVFSAEDFSGNVLTNNQNNKVIAVNLQFYQVLSSIQTAKSAPVADYYRWRTRVTRRVLE